MSETFNQPAEPIGEDGQLIQPGPLPDKPEQLAPGVYDFDLPKLADLGTDEVGAVLAHLTDVQDRLTVIRALHDHRNDTRGAREFEAEVAILREKRRARREADRLDKVEMEEYLSSEEGQSDAADAFEAGFPDIDNLPDPEPIIEGFLYRETLVRTFGPPKSMKSFVTLDMAACVSLGIPWHGHDTRQTRVLYIVAEGARGFAKRRAAWNEHHQDEMKVIPYARPVQISDPEEMHRLISYCRTREIGYVIFDTQARCTVGVEENDNTQMGEVVHALDVLKEQTGACVHVIHHSTGSDATKARGATAWDGAVDSEFMVKRDRSVNADAELEFRTKFQKDVEEAMPITFDPVRSLASVVLVSRGGGTGGPGGGAGEVSPALVSEANAVYLRAIREFGNQHPTITDIEKHFKESNVTRSRSAIKKAFGALEACAAVQSVGDGTKVRITQAGLVYLDRNPEPYGDAQTVLE